MHTFGERKEICGKAPALKIIWTIGRKTILVHIIRNLILAVFRKISRHRRVICKVPPISVARISSWGYTLPKSLLSPAGISNCRIYLSCDNLFTITSLSDIFDPEAFGGYGDEGWGSGKTYPLQRTVSVGVNLSFLTNKKKNIMKNK